MFPGDGVLGVHREGDGPQPSPKRDKLPDVLHCPVVGELDFGQPRALQIRLHMIYTKNKWADSELNKHMMTSKTKCNIFLLTLEVP